MSSSEGVLVKMFHKRDESVCKGKVVSELILTGWTAEAYISVRSQRNVILTVKLRKQNSSGKDLSLSTICLRLVRLVLGQIGFSDAVCYSSSALIRMVQYR